MDVCLQPLALSLRDAGSKALPPAGEDLRCSDQQSTQANLLPAGLPSWGTKLRALAAHGKGDTEM